MKKTIMSVMLVVVLMFSSACAKKSKTENSKKETTLGKEGAVKTETDKNFQQAEITFLDAEENPAAQYYAVTDTLIFEQVMNLAGEEIPTDSLKYYMADLSGDGNEELVVTDAERLYLVYTMEKGHPECIHNEILIGNKQPDIPCVVKYKNDYYAARFFADEYIPGIELSKYINKEEVTVVSATTVLNEDSSEICGYEIDGKHVSKEEYEAFKESLEKIEYYNASQLEKMAKAVKPEKNKAIDYEMVYSNFIDSYKEQIGVRSGYMAPVIKEETFDASQFRAEEGFVTHVIKDFNSDGVEDLVTIQEVETESNGMAMSVSASTFYIKVYTVSDKKIVCMDAYWIGGKDSVPPLPTFSYVDITCKNNIIMIANVGVWCAGGGGNEHYVFTLDKNKFDVEYIDFEGEESIEKGNSEKLARYGFDSLNAGSDTSAQRLALYSLFGSEGQNVDYFGGTVNEPAGFYNYNN